MKLRRSSFQVCTEKPKQIADKGRKNMTKKEEILYEAAKYGYVMTIMNLDTAEGHDFSFSIPEGDTIEADIVLYKSETLSDAASLIGLVKKTEAHTEINFDDLKAIIHKKNSTFRPSNHNPSRIDMIIKDETGVLEKIHYNVFLEYLRKDLRDVIIDTPYTEILFLTKGHSIIPLKEIIQNG